MFAASIPQPPASATGIPNPVNSMLLRTMPTSIKAKPVTRIPMKKTVILLFINVSDIRVEVLRLDVPSLQA